MKHEPALVILALVSICTVAVWAADGDPVAADRQAFRGLVESNRLEEAEALARTLLADAEARDGSSSPSAAQALDLLAEVLQRQQHLEEAEAIARRAVAIKEEAAKPEPAELALSLRTLGTILRLSEAFDEAEPILRRSLFVMEAGASADQLGITESMNALANLFMVMHRYDEAQPLYERILSINMAVLGTDNPELARNHYNLASLFRRLGELSQAREHYERALSLKKNDPNVTPMALTPYLNGLAIFRWRTGDYAGARDLYEEALEIRTTAQVGESLDVASLKNNLGLLLRDMRDYKEARQMLEQALQVRAGKLPANHTLVAQSRHNLAVTLYLLGDHDEARRQFERALTALIETLGADSQVVATSQMGLADVLIKVGAFGEAGRRYAAAREIAIKTGEPSDLAWSLHGLATSQAGQGQHEEAVPLFQEALDLRREALGDSHPVVAEGLMGLATSLASLGKNTEALDASLQAEAIARDHVVLTSRTLAERQALRYSTDRVAALDLALSLLPQTPGETAVSLVLDALIRSRALVLDELATRRQALGAGDDADTTALAETLRVARRDLARLTVEGPDPHAPGDYRVRLDQARREKEAAERELAARSLTFRADLERERSGLDEVRAALPQNSALVSFVLHDQDSLEAKAVVASRGASYGAFVLRLGRPETIRFVHLGPATRITALINDWRKEIMPGRLAAGTAEAAESAYRQAGEHLRQAVWDPVMAAAGDIGTLFVVADGDLHLVSLAALPASGDRYLGETAPLIHYLSAERDLIRNETGRKPGVGLLAVGGPDFDVAGSTDQKKTYTTVSAAHPDAGCSDFRDLRFAPLPGTRRESEDIVSLWEGIDGTGTIAYATGTDATETLIKTEAAGKRVVHLATHGFFLDKECLRSAPGSRGIGGLSPAPAESAHNPLHLSGLALAGANLRAQAGPTDEDGILTADEIAGLDLRGVEWAVLSACDTGRGEVLVGEGVFGLRRAFQIAGAGTVVMSLWALDDSTAHIWMRSLYEQHFVHGLATGEAIRQVNIDILQERRENSESTHPFYWGGIVAVGDWN